MATSHFCFIPKHMDTDAIEDLVDKLKVMQNDDVEDQEEYDDVDDDEEEEEHEPITLGFVDKPKNKWSLQRQYFPSKAGGVPAWLDPMNIPSGGSFGCDICGDPLQFLLQVYAPTEQETAFHRMLYVFMCPSMKCLLRDQHEQWKHHPEKPSRSVKVFRCQLRRVNPFYSEECPQYNESHKPAGCGGFGLHVSAFYETNCPESTAILMQCVLTFQLFFVIGVALGKETSFVVVANRHGHKIACPQIQISSPVSGSNKSETTLLGSHRGGSKNLWPEFEISIEDESEYSRDMSEENTVSNSLISRNRTDDTMNSIFDSFQGDADKNSWASFQECIDKAPEQVLRYYRNTNAKPIWPLSSGRPSNADIPRCSYCSGPMCCEFQILPQLLYYFGVDNEVDSLDWASIVVYACEASCNASLPYTHEFAWVQIHSPSTGL
ncbi:pre-rRNA-processing protein TSR4 [Vigna unguiculata]|uniref:Pre-rRNA-processing protein TSR4 n=1 Tax=Vigna unguiculata TaxID=3917 RepID=A0A4D6KIH6_VIGUN|nr:pre-rRNA-processing protein TSR4 [Vigna unguiculata]